MPLDLAALGNDRMNDRGGASAAALRKSAETMLGAYLDTGGFEFMGVQG